MPEVSKGKVHITQNKHVPIEWFVTTASQSRIWLKLLSDDSNKVGICLLCRSTQLHATTSCRSQFATTCDSSYVLQSSTPYWKVLLCTTPVLQSTTPVLVCTTKYYSGILLCTTKYYSSTSLYYKVPSHMKRYLQCAEQQESASNFSKYCACHKKWLSWSILFTHETLFTMRGVTSVIVQTHQILRLPRKMNLMIDPCHTWNAIYNARSNKCHCPNSPNTAPATKNESHDWSLSHMKRYLQCAEQQVSLSKLTKYSACHAKWLSWSILFTHETLFTMRGVTGVIVQTHQILRLPRKMTLMINPLHTWNAIYNARSNTCHCPNSPNTAPATKNESHAWSLSHMKRYLQCAEQQVKCHCPSSPNTAPPRKMTLMINPLHTWNAIYNARSNKCHCPNSPNTAPATKNESHEWSLSHMKRYLQCAEQQVSLSKLTKYCACHAKWLSKISDKFLENSWNVISNAGPIRAWSEHETVSPQPASQPRLLFELTTTKFYGKIQHFAPRLTFKNSPSAAPATKSNTWTSPSAAPATQNDSHDWSSSHMKRYFQCAEQQVSSSNITEYCACHAKWLSSLILVTYETLFTMRGATGVIAQPHRILRLPRKITLQNFSKISPKQMKRHLQCATDPRPIQCWSDKCNRHSATRLATEVTFRAQHEHILLKNATFRAPAIIPNFTKCCARHEKWHLNFTKCCAYHEKCNMCHPPTSPNTAPATQKDSHNGFSSHMKRYLQCAEQQISSSNITEYSACHAKWLSSLILVTYETLFTMRGATGVIAQPHRILRLPRKITLQNFLKISPKQMKRHLQCATDPRPIRPWSENETVTPQPASQPRRLLFALSTSIFYWKIQHFALRLSFQISPNTAPATKSDSSTSQILRLPRKVTLQFNVTKCCARHEKWHYATLLFSSLLFATLFYSSLLFATLLYSSLLFATILLRI